MNCLWEPHSTDSHCSTWQQLQTWWLMWQHLCQPHCTMRWTDGLQTTISTIMKSAKLLMSTTGTISYWSNQQSISKNFFSWWMLLIWAGTLRRDGWVWWWEGYSLEAKTKCKHEDAANHGQMIPNLWIREYWFLLSSSYLEAKNFSYIWLLSCWIHDVSLQKHLTLNGTYQQVSSHCFIDITTHQKECVRIVQTNEVNQCLQGGSRIKKECLGLNFLVKPHGLDLPTYVIRHMSIYGNMTSSLWSLPSLYKLHISCISLWNVFSLRMASFMWRYTFSHCIRTSIIHIWL